MKQLLILLLLGFVSCSNEETRIQRAKIEQVHFTEVIHDGCEYLVYVNATPGSYAYTYSFTHKGNCKNHSE